MFDTHTHTDNSNDCKQKIDELCESAIEKGISLITITDHVDFPDFYETKSFERIEKSFRDVDEARTKYKNKLKISKGIEFGEIYKATEKEKVILSHPDIDVVIGSVHQTLYKGIDTFFSQIDFSVFTLEFLEEYFEKYLSEVLLIAKCDDIDVLAHLTCLLRYVNGKYKRNLNATKFTEKIKEILSVIIEKGVALEVNTSGIGSFYGEYMPSFDFLRLYYDLGGRLITLASDAHTPDAVGNAFQEAKEMLKSIGFKEYYYFEKRKPVAVRL